jgi:SH3-like domain-containing protein
LLDPPINLEQLIGMTMASAHPRRTWRLANPMLGLAIGALLGAVGVPCVQAQGSGDAPASLAYGGNLKQRTYASVKADSVLLRQGPGPDHPTAWKLQRLGLPVEVLEEQGAWRKVRDANNATGWVHMNVLSRRRTALILPWEVKEGLTQVPSAALREDDREGARPIGQVGAGVLANIRGCGGGWCRVSVGKYRGYIEQTKLWGTNPNEEIK